MTTLDEFLSEELMQLDDDELEALCKAIEVASQLEDEIELNKKGNNENE